MKICYENSIAKGYTTHMSSDNDLFFISTDPLNKCEIKNLELYNSELNTHCDIYLSLANAIGFEGVSNFCRKYGSLVSPSHLLPSSISTHNYSTLFNELNIAGTHKTESDCKYDLIMYSHFRFYQKEMEFLINIQKHLSHNLINVDDLQQLCKLCQGIINRPDLGEIILLEYSNAMDSAEMVEMFRSYSLCLLRYLLSYKKSSSEIKKTISSTPNPNIDFYFLLNKLYPNNLYEQNDTLTNFLLQHRADIIDLSKNVFNEFLTYQLREIYPIATNPMHPEQSSWFFPSLLSAIFFVFNYDISDWTSSFIFKKCANSNCGKLFKCPVSHQNRKIYCSHTCANRVTTRTYNRKIRKAEKEKKKNNL